MSEFTKFVELVRARFDKMKKDSVLYEVEVDKHVIWDHYLDSFPEDTNEIYKERREYDCNTCKNFIRDIGNVVIINKDGLLESIWDVPAEGYYAVVTKAMNDFVVSGVIKNILSSHTAKVGAKKTLQEPTEDEPRVKTWNHFYAEVPNKYVAITGEELGRISTSKSVYKRGLDEISESAVEIVLELMAQNSLYRGEEFKTTVEGFKKLQTDYKKLSGQKADNYCWLTTKKKGAYIKNSVIGTLLIDISEGKELDAAVGAYEAKTAAVNYKRPTALITQGMIDEAMKTIEELNMRDALERRFAVAEDLSVNNVLFAHRGTAAAMKDSLLDSLQAEVKPKKNLSKMEDISIDDFVKDIIPKIDNMEIMIENKHISNMMSLTAPVHADAPNLFKWDNGFAWVYRGNVTDSIKERVKTAGGNVEGHMRFSIQWNEENNNKNDFDAHCIEPSGRHIEFGSSGRTHPSSGMLDVDIVNPTNEPAVENITWTDPNKMPAGDYKMFVHNFSDRGGRDGFRAQIELDGTIYNLSYNKPIPNSHNVQVATVTYNKDGSFKFVPHIESDQQSREEYGIKTESFKKVNILTISPNHWDDQSIGNKHYFFIVDGMKNEEKTRGFFNEYLKPELEKHRKVFEVLGSKTRCEPSDNQLTGIGFSSTMNASVIVKVSGTFNRLLKIKF